jgi:hypothetical protein
MFAWDGDGRNVIARRITDGTITAEQAECNVSFVTAWDTFRLA